MLGLPGGAIDVHTHVVPESFPAYLGGSAGIAWPSVEHTGCGHARVLVGGKPYRDIDDRCWNAGKRVEGMAAMGIARQILSPMPELLSYWLPAPDARDLARHMNEQIAALVAEAPAHFIGFGMVPLQSVELAIEELIHLTEHLGLAGIELGTNIDGRPLGHPDFASFFAEAEARGVPILVHPLRPAVMDRLVGPAFLEQIVAFPGETALAIASMMTGGTLARHPDLRIAFSHGGGGFGQLLARLQQGWTMAPALRKAMPTGPVDLSRRLFFDTLVYDRTALRFLAERFGVDQLMIGTDFPFAIMEPAPVTRLTEAGFSAGDIKKVTQSNALRFLGERLHVG